MANERPSHFWAGDDDGHSCADCPDGSIWRCDPLAHIDMDAVLALPDEFRKRLADYRRAAAVQATSKAVG